MKTVVAVALATLSLVSTATAAPVWTAFKPDGNGFRFVNGFANNAVPELNIRTAGLCGGMSYAALDFYYAKRELPRQDYRPANGTQLQAYLYGRQVDSIMSNLDRWAEYGFNPDGVRSREFFSWGIGPARIAELRSFIDKGTPAVLGLQGAGTGSHQVIAVGYDLGRYKGDLGAYLSDFKIFIYDPNHPGKTVTLIPHPADATFILAEHPEENWRSYFVDPNYRARVPPPLPNPKYPNDGLVRELLLQFYTGADDLRGGNDNVVVTVKLKNGLIFPFPNVNAGSRWLNCHEETARVILPQPVAQADLDALTVTSTFGGGIGGDNWDMAKLVVRCFGGGFDKIVKRVGYHRFSGKDSMVVSLKQVPTPPGTVDTLTIDVSTGRDDLRGGNANLDVLVHYRNGLKDEINYVNGTMNWPANSLRYEYLSLALRYPVADIVDVTLMTTESNDNWDMKSIEITAWGPGLKQKIGWFPYFPFTPKSRVLKITTKPMP